jgi:hypothetical protein
MSSSSCRPRPLPRLLGLLLFAATACGTSPVEWAPQLTVMPSATGEVAVGVDGIVRPDSMLALASRVAPPQGPRCDGSLRVAASRGTLYGVWWAPRADSGARLLAARSADGGRTWSAPVPVDTIDVGVTGCRRAPPAIAADSVSGYVHVTYALQAAEGPGLFFSHSMDDGISFHAPVPILYGERLGHTSVAADGDLVVVAFEDPNSRTPRIGLALSRTMGHIFEHRILPLSDDHESASRPLTAVAGRRVAVAWTRGGAGASTLAVRTGTVR